MVWFSATAHGKEGLLIIIIIIIIIAMVPCKWEYARIPMSHLQVGPKAAHVGA